MKNTVLPCLLLLCIEVTPALAQRYQGVNIRNRKARQHRPPRPWRHEMQFTAKFPNARAVALQSWLNTQNLNDSRTYPTQFSLACYTTPYPKMAFGLELFYDENDNTISNGSSIVYIDQRKYLTLMAHVRYSWYKGDDEHPFEWYSDCGIGYGKDFGKGARYYGNLSEYDPVWSWQYDLGLQLQAVLAGCLIGKRKLRGIAELGYGTMYIFKAGLNYRFTTP